jgi:nitrogen regulatory protein P-II 1
VAEVRGLTVSGVQGHGGELEQVETCRGTRVKLELHPKVRLEIGVSEPFVERRVQILLASAWTGEVGNGKVFVLPVEKVYRIRTQDDCLSAGSLRTRTSHSALRTHSGRRYPSTSSAPSG